MKKNIRKKKAPKECRGPQLLEWKDGRTRAGELGRCSARLPGGIGSICIVHKEDAERNFFTLWYKVDSGRYPGCSGMARFDGYRFMEDMKADAPRLLQEMFLERERELKEKISGIENARSICFPDGCRGKGQYG